MLDVNAGIPLVDEAGADGEAMRAVQDAVDVPLCIDSSVIEALEAGLSVYEGRALVNSVTAEDERLEEILPLVAKHGAAVIGACQRRDRHPEGAAAATGVRAQDRLGRRRLRDQDRGRDHRPAGDDRRRRAEAVTSTLATIALIRDELGVNMASAPPTLVRPARRHMLGAGFLPMAARRGVDERDHGRPPRCASNAVRARDLLLGHDPWGANWIAALPRDAGGRRLRQRERQAARPRLDRERRPTTATASGSVFERRRGNEVRVPAGTPIFDARAGTASRSTRPAAATAPARSARSSRLGRAVAVGRSTRARSPRAS